MDIQNEDNIENSENIIQDNNTKKVRTWMIVGVSGVGIILCIVVFIVLFTHQSSAYTKNKSALREQVSTTTASTTASTTQTTVTISHPTLLKWEQATTTIPWEPRDAGDAFVFNDKLWLIGGVDGNGYQTGPTQVKYWDAPHFDDVWNTSDGITWNKVADHSLPYPRRSITVTPFKGKLWMMGGWSPKKGYENDIWTSDDGFTWKRAINHAQWPPREGHMVEVFQNKLWLIGGVNYDDRETKNDVWYSDDGIAWKEAPQAPWKSRWDHATTIHNGELFVSGGMNLEHETFNDVWATKDGITWRQVTAHAQWEPRQGHAMESFGGYLWVIGRHNDKESGGANNVWFSKDNGLTWIKTQHDPQWTGREDFFSAQFKGTLWVFGGMDANWIWKNDVWKAVF